MLHEVQTNWKNCRIDPGIDSQKKERKKNYNIVLVLTVSLIYCISGELTNYSKFLNSP